MTKTLPSRASSRISPKVRAAVELRVRRGLSIAAAADEAGLSRNGLAKALKRPAVEALMSDLQVRFLAEVNSKREVLRARALEVAADMLETETDSRTKLRLIEFLAGDTKGPSVAVNVDARQVTGGYEYVRPGQRTIVIEE